MNKLLLVLLLAISSVGIAAEKGYSTLFTPLSLFDYKLDKFNEGSYDYCALCRGRGDIEDKNFKRQALALLDDITVKKGEEPFRLDVSIDIRNGVLFHKQDNKTKQYIVEIILEEIEYRLRCKVSSEIKKEHLFGEFTWSSFPNAEKEVYRGKAKFEKGRVVDVEVKVEDYSPNMTMSTYIGNGISVDENGKVMEKTKK